MAVKRPGSGGGGYGPGPSLGATAKPKAKNWSSSSSKTKTRGTVKYKAKISADDAGNPELIYTTATKRRYGSAGRGMASAEARRNKMAKQERKSGEPSRTAKIVSARKPSVPLKPSSNKSIQAAAQKKKGKK